MRILWIEDFGGGLQADEKTLINLFQELISAKKFDQWDAETDLLENPEALSDFSRQHHPYHDLVLCRHFTDFANLCETLQRAGKQITNWFDVAVIDINLANGCDPEHRPEHFADRSDFHRRAGFWIFNTLVQEGFPRERICFMTGEKGSTYEDFVSHCKAALLPFPRAFEKSDREYREFRIWLHEFIEDKYLTMRRGILDGCFELLQRIENNPGCVRRDLFDSRSANSEQAEGDRLSGEDSCAQVRNYLWQLIQLLPNRFGGDSSTQRIKVIASAITHDWSELKPQAFKDNLGTEWKGTNKEYRSAKAFAEVAKTARNWIAHQQLQALQPEDVALLFLINMRAWLKLEDKSSPYERLLLDLIKVDADDPLSAEAIHRLMKCEYKKIENSPSRFQGWRFTQFANEGVKSRRLAASRKLLYQIFWFELSDPDQRSTGRPDVSWLFPRQTNAPVSRFVSDLAAAISSASFMSPSGR